MASIVKRKKSFAVVYTYKNEEGVRKQKWETYYSHEAALKRKLEIDNPIEFLHNRLVTTTINDLLDEYIQIYGKLKWSFSTYDSRTRLLNNYVRPVLGKVLLAQADKHVMSRYFAYLRTSGTCSPSEITVFEIYKLLHSVFEQAVHWGYFNENIVHHMGFKQPDYGMRKTLSPDEIADYINHCLKCGNTVQALMVHLAFTCSMRKGEILGLCWDDIDFDKNAISINKELLRVSKDSLSALDERNIYEKFHSHVKGSRSILVLKQPKTMSSIRTIYMTPSLVRLLKTWRDKQVDIPGTQDGRKYDLIFTQQNGRPLCPRKCNEEFKHILADLNMPEVVFHSLRHSSTSFKLILSGGNIKAVQGDNGHAQPRMVLSVYAQINDKDRKNLAQEMEARFGSLLTYKA